MKKNQKIYETLELINSLCFSVALIFSFREIFKKFPDCKPDFHQLLALFFLTAFMNISYSLKYELYDKTHEFQPDMELELNR